MYRRTKLEDLQILIIKQNRYFRMKKAKSTFKQIKNEIIDVIQHSTMPAHCNQTHSTTISTYMSQENQNDQIPINPIHKITKGKHKLQKNSSKTNNSINEQRMNAYYDPLSWHKQNIQSRKNHHISPSNQQKSVQNCLQDITNSSNSLLQSKCRAIRQKKYAVPIRSQLKSLSKLRMRLTWIDLTKGLKRNQSNSLPK